jgi:RHH-type rel operon transcriptional repressor/antitoxin RelB
MVSVELPLELEERLNKLTELTDKPKSFHILEALENYIEDMEDGYTALERIKNPHRTLLTTEEVLKALGAA